ncbi:unnamed protein product [Cylindrotheca closterium]|uniref:Pre-mRNA-splicing factor 18 n=1 Tax=Cylindrotheca closterium TaxID=2856 RepID=A0AAD2CVB5_9STRA|nr:unnamed protein product [Cylindrotheca closterium]
MVQALPVPDADQAANLKRSQAQHEEKENADSLSDSGKDKGDNSKDDDAEGGKKESSKKKSGTVESSQVSEEDQFSPSSITKQLREFGLPIQFFGESHNQRFQRLKDALEQQKKSLAGQSEMDEFRLGKGHGIRNTFLGRKEDQGQQQQQQQQQHQNKKRKLEEERKETKVKEAAADNDDQDDPPKVIYKFFKTLLKQWEQDLTERSDIVARSLAGRNESRTLKQCKDYIRPLFKLCKSRKLGEGIQGHLMKIVQFAKEGEFVRANDAYIDVSIGRAAWPIGVTMVGIHARSGREKIGAANVAHVMNSELQRKYLTSVKRLLTYAQKKRPDVDPSKKVS